MAEWKIRRRQGACNACESPFEEGQRHASLLHVAEEELRRDDLCAACWQAHEASTDDLLWWFTRHQPQRKRTLQLDLASLERLFLELEGREERKLREVRYLLCLLLMRKRRLRLERVKRGRSGEALIVRRPRRKKELEVFVFDFDAERIDQLRGELQEILDGAAPSDEDAPSEEAVCAEGAAPLETEAGDPGGAEPASPETKGAVPPPASEADPRPGGDPEPFASAAPAAG